MESNFEICGKQAWSLECVCGVFFEKNYLVCCCLRAKTVLIFCTATNFGLRINHRTHLLQFRFQFVSFWCGEFECLSTNIFHRAEIAFLILTVVFRRLLSTGRAWNMYRMKPFFLRKLICWETLSSSVRQKNCNVVKWLFLDDYDINELCRNLWICHAVVHLKCFVWQTAVMQAFAAIGNTWIALVKRSVPCVGWNAWWNGGLSRWWTVKFIHCSFISTRYHLNQLVSLGYLKLYCK